MIPIDKISSDDDLMSCKNISKAGLIKLRKGLTDKQMIAMGFAKGRTYWNLGQISINIKFGTVYINTPQSHYGGKIQMPAVLLRLAKLGLIDFEENIRS